MTYSRPFRGSHPILAYLLLVGLLWLLAPLHALEARLVRVASYNIENGTGGVGSEKYEALRAIIARVGADVVAFQELRPSTFLEWEVLADELGYSYTAISANGPLSGGLYNGFYSRYPILSTHNVTSPPGAVELTRFPFRAVIEVPDAQLPLVVWNMHHKAGSASIDKFRRSIEAYRIVQDIDAYLSEFPDHVEYLFIGDLNDDVRDSQSPAFFFSQPSGAPLSYAIGDDIVFPVPYALFPTDRYALAGEGLTMLPAYWEGTTTGTTRWPSGRQLDYLYVSPAILNSPLGMPAAEVYHSQFDSGFSGLPKAGDPPNLNAVFDASDHLPVFADIYMADASDVVPTSVFVAMGEAGGPFDPPTRRYTVTNTNDSPRTWTVVPGTNWLSVSATAFTLPPMTFMEVDVTLNANAELLLPGTHTSEAIFYNVTEDVFHLRPVVLDVRDYLEMTLPEGWGAAGPPGGPFEPPSASYTLTNKSALSVGWSAWSDAGWLSPSPASGVLAASQGATLVVALNSQAALLPIGEYQATMMVSNHLSGLTFERDVSLTVQPPLCAAVEACQLSWTTGGTEPWFAQTLESWDGEDAAQSGWITAPGEISWMETEVEGPVRVSFQWRVSSRFNWDILRFRTNGVSTASISGERDWALLSRELPEGSHVLRWAYDKNSSTAQGANAGWVDRVTVDYLLATPTSTFFVSGPPGGPFAPETRIYTLTNAGPATVEWSAEPTVDWLSVHPVSGSLAPGEHMQVQATITATANALASGTRPGAVAFSNLTAGVRFERAVSLQVRDYLVIAPSDSPTAVGFPGGPYEPAAQSYLLSNSAPFTVDWTVGASSNWVGVAPLTGTLAPGEVATVETTINGNADALVPDWYWSSIVFTNLTTGLQQWRWQYLLIEVPPDVSPESAWMATGPYGGLFEPETRSYTLLNITAQPQTWHLSANTPWISPQSAIVTVPAGGTLPVEFALNFNAWFLPIGSHAGSLSFSNAVSGQVVAQSVFVQVAVTLCDAVDQCDLAWTTGGHADWFYQTEFAADGVDAAASGEINDNQESWIETVVRGPGTLRYWWKVDSEGGWDFLELRIDGMLQSGRISGQVDWQQREHLLGSGLHVLRWRYVKDFTISVGADRGWLDQVEWVPDRTAMGVPIGWYERFGLSPGPGMTWDSLDHQPSIAGPPYWQQFVSGLDPTDPAAVLRIFSIAPGPGQRPTLAWWGGTNGPSSVYLIQRAKDAASPWQTIGQSPRADGMHTWTSPAAFTGSDLYRIVAEPD